MYTVHVDVQSSKNYCVDGSKHNRTKLNACTIETSWRANDLIQTTGTGVHDVIHIPM